MRYIGIAYRFFVVSEGDQIMENNICKRIMFLKVPFFARIKVFKYPRKGELCIQIEHRVRQWGVKSPNGAWKCKSFWLHY